MAGIKEVKALRKCDKRKQALASLMKGHTLPRPGGILERWEMGAPQQSQARAMAGFLNGPDQCTQNKTDHMPRLTSTQ